MNCPMNGINAINAPIIQPASCEETERSLHKNLPAALSEVDQARTSMCILQQESVKCGHAFKVVSAQGRKLKKDHEDLLSKVKDGIAVIEVQRREMEVLRQSVPKEPALCAPLPDHSLINAATDALRGTSHTGVGTCNVMAKATVTAVRIVHNPELWERYTRTRKNLKEQCPFPLVPDPGGLLSRVQGIFPWIIVDKGVNEVLVLHGTSADTAEAIAQHGYDVRRSHEHHHPTNKSYV